MGKMLGSGENFLHLHLLLLLSFPGWIEGTAPGKEVPAKSSELSSWSKGVLASASMQQKDLNPPNWLPVLNHLTSSQIDVAAKKRKRSVSQSGFRSKRGTVKPKSIKSKQKKGLDGRKRKTNFPMDRIGRMYLPKIRY
ncbi:hypothetical protein chiPu_0015867 [Chiloscyllium punctatum]|uniref:Uncharacterized protein n=1 Tax=Chiloscyllium punctatum TaxID=137246 RepID=A0A401T3X0_CHIPU|nr:hypothetical protein [Chiloscyllium punctatum]